MTLLCTKCDSEVIDASRDEIAQMRARIADLEAELAAVRVEAERYRFARSWGGTQHAHWNATPEQFDAAIDAAMRAEG